jgi:prophage maintenance system killer protein
MDSKGGIQIYKSYDGAIEISVVLDRETIWLTQRQMSFLFDKDKDTIGLHIKNIIETGELDELSTTEYFSVVQSEGNRKVKRNLKHYNLDMIISVGYRVNSMRGTQFRIWANKILKEYLIQGYSYNRKLLEQKTEKLNELRNSIELISRISASNLITQDETISLIKVISNYSRALDILDGYDHKDLVKKISLTKESYLLTYSDAINIISQLKEQFGSSELFGKEKDNSFISSISTIYQTFDGNELYPGVEPKAANLLYFIVKNHSFVDGNKRIAAAIFIWFLAKNKILFKSDGNKIIDDAALVGITLMIAESNPKEREIIINVVLNLLIQD